MTSRTKRGFTLVELLLAVAITSVIGLAVAGVASALSVAYAHSGELYESLQTGRSAMTRVQDMLRKAKLVTAATSDSLIIWTGDANGDGLINRDELATVYLDAAAKTLRQCSVVFPATMDPTTKASLNYTVSLDSTLVAAPAGLAIRNDAYSQDLLLAENVTEFQVAAIPQPPLSMLVQIAMKVGQGARPLALRSAACLRLDPQRSVTWDQSGYALVPPGLLPLGN